MLAHVPAATGNPALPGMPCRSARLQCATCLSHARPPARLRRPAAARRTACPRTARWRRRTRCPPSAARPPTCATSWRRPSCRWGPLLVMVVVVGGGVGGWGEVGVGGRTAGLTPQRPAGAAVRNPGPHAAQLRRCIPGAVALTPSLPFMASLLPPITHTHTPSPLRRSTPTSGCRSPC